MIAWISSLHSINSDAVLSPTTIQGMKKVYTHTFSDEREKVENMIDNYFQETLGIKKDDIDKKKYIHILYYQVH